MSYDTEGRRVGSVIDEGHRAWCEACAWFGPDRRGFGSRGDAAADGLAHDTQTHPSTNNA